MTKAAVPSLEVQFVDKLAYAKHVLRRFNSERIEVLIHQLDSAIADTRYKIPDIDLDCSIYPGEDKGDPPPSRDPPTYVLDHLLPRALVERSRRKLELVHGIRELVFKLEPEEFVALLVLYALHHSNEKGIRRAYDVLVNKMQPYRKLITSYKNAASGGLAKITSPTQYKRRDRDEKIIKRAEELSENGMAKRDIASHLANKSELGVRQIRNILKKAEAC